MKEMVTRIEVREGERREGEDWDWDEEERRDMKARELKILGWRWKGEKGGRDNNREEKRELKGWK